MKNIIGLLVSILLVSCSGENKLDESLRDVIIANKLDAQFLPDFTNDKNNPALAELGGLLFFSPDLSIDGSVSCASCHHPDKGGGDGLSLPIGVGGVKSTNIGKDRLKASLLNNPSGHLEGLIPRNAPTVFNAVLFRQNLFWDGRVQYRLDPDNPGVRVVQAGVFGAGQFNPSNYKQSNLLQTQARMPLTSSFEMKGGLKPNNNNHEIEQEVLRFLQGNTRWCEEFSKVYGKNDCVNLITLNHLTEALAGFQASLVFTDSAFERYIRGEKSALTKQQKEGALAFFNPVNEGGLGCVSCHSGKNFTNEKFYNVNIPPSGRGANHSGWDLGRNNVEKSAEKFSFRVPSLLNIGLTAPYFHNGVALTLQDAVMHMQSDPVIVKPAKIIEMDDIDFLKVRKAIADAFDSSTGKLILPQRIPDKQLADVVAFLDGLSDACLLDKSCREKIKRPVIESPRPHNIDSVSKHSVLRVKSGELIVPAINCTKHIKGVSALSGFKFSEHNLDIGLQHQRSVGLIKKGWLVDVVNYGSVAVMDVNYDCYDDLLFDAGENGLFFYRQFPDGSFKSEAIPYKAVDGALNALTVDLDGDYKFDMFVGNLGRGSAAFVFDFVNSKSDVVEMDTLTGPVINASFGDIKNRGYIDVIFGMWRSFNSIKQDHIWINDGAGNLAAQDSNLPLYQDKRNMGMGDGIKPDAEANLIRGEHDTLGSPEFTFTPNFADIDKNGTQDLLLASDFFRSQVLQNTDGIYKDITDKTVIDDSNGMGVAVGDFNGDELLDWFVTSINNGQQSKYDGQRLYMGERNGLFRQRPVPQKDIEWSWGACAADFNNDGHLDIFYVSGYGEFLKTAKYEVLEQQRASEKFLKSMEMFAKPTPVLLLNDGLGNFVDQSNSVGFENYLSGRGASCFDYQQDGDIDILVAPVEGSPVLYKNHLDGGKNWLSIRFIGLPGNTEALGTKVTLYTSVGKQYREVRFENNFISRNPAQLHFGLGGQSKIDKLVIQLPPPNPREIELNNLEINKLHILYVEKLLTD